MAHRTRAADERLAGVTDWLGNTTTFAYDPDSNPQSTTFPTATGDVDSYGYDNEDQMTSAQMTHGSSTLASISYTRDPDSQVTNESQTGLPGPASTSYTYTPPNQLASAGSSSYSYDNAGDPTTLAGNSGYSYDAANELTGSPATADADQTSPVATSYAYDQLGERTSATAAGGLPTSYTYDQAGRLIKSSPATYPVSVGGGYLFSTALQSNGTVLAWGNASAGELGNGSTANTNQTTPAEVHDLAGVTQLSTTWSDSLALKADGSVWAWGYNTNGQLGDGTRTNRSTPVHVTGLPTITSVATSQDDSYAIAESGNVWAWGDNTVGELAESSSGYSATPLQVQGISDVSQIAAGYGSAIALKSDGTVWTWGYNGYGALGTGSSDSQSNSPVQVPGLSGVTQVAAGRYTDYALKSDGTVWTWGYGADGGLGDGTTTNSQTTPEQIPGLSNVTKIIAGPGYTPLAVENNGTVWTWGLNNEGQVGNGTTTNQLTPTQLEGITNPVALGEGVGHALALTTPTNLETWGWNNVGQLGNGTTTNSTTPAQAPLYQATPAAPTTTYTYDGNGLRATSTTTGTTEEYAWDQAANLLTDGSTSYIYGPNNLPIEQIDNDGTVLDYHQDQLGSTRLLTNASGTLAGSFTYNPYGSLADSTGSTTTSLGYASQYTDPNTGLIYMQARWYDPSTGQFMTVDPLQAITQQPYAYTADNPINSTDPTGMDDAAGWGLEGSSRNAAACQEDPKSIDCAQASLGQVAEAAVGTACIASIIGAPECAVAGLAVFAGNTIATLTNQCLSTAQRVVGVGLDAVTSAPGWAGSLGDLFGGLGEAGVGRTAVNVVTGTVGAGGFLAGPALIKKAGEDSGSSAPCGCGST